MGGGKVNRYICTKCSLYCYSAASLETMRDDHCPYPGCGGRIVPAPEEKQTGQRAPIGLDAYKKIPLSE